MLPMHANAPYDTIGSFQLNRVLTFEPTQAAHESAHRTKSDANIKHWLHCQPDLHILVQKGIKCAHKHATESVP